MSDSISSIVEGDCAQPTLLQNIQSLSSSQASTLGMCSLTLSGETLISLGLNVSSNEFNYQSTRFFIVVLDFSIILQPSFLVSSPKVSGDSSL